MRLVVFTANPELGSSPFWPVVTGNRDVSAILVVRRIPRTGGGAALARLRRNVRKHGLIYVPYRAAVLIVDGVRTLVRGHREPTPLSSGTRVPIEEITTIDLHAPEILERVRAWKPDLGVSLGAPLLKPQLFSIPRMGTLNVHLGRVPEYRGAPPGFWELWMGEKSVGATVHWIDAGLDTGPVVAEGRAPIYLRDTPSRVEMRATELGVSLFARALRDAAEGKAEGRPQQGIGRTNRFPTVWQRARLSTRLWWRRTRPRIADPAYAMKVGAASVWLAICCPVLEIMRTIRGKHPVRVFTFHRVTDLCRDGMTVPADVFERQVEYLRRHHDVVGLDRALALLSNGHHLTRPVAVITFDDGYRSVSSAARPVMQAAGVPGATFVCTGLVGTGTHLAHDDGNPVEEWLDLMDWSEIHALAGAGWHIGGHTETHPRLSQLDPPTLAREVRAPLEALRNELGSREFAMAYPFGGETDINDAGVETAREAGYAALFSDYGGENFPGTEQFALRRIDIGGDHDTLMWKAAVRGLDLAKWGRRMRDAGLA
jgi:peptidoglycan/xylan/chitin deacetylase (PgdA/CDA1 family)/folate-dependent phosphoribosylglycinamide formyltransferase PurN